VVLAFSFFYLLATTHSSTSLPLLPLSLLDPILDHQVEYFWPPFRAAVQGASVASIMCSYNNVNGVPSCANGAFLNGVLRDAWGWQGFVISDCGAIKDGAAAFANAAAHPGANASALADAHVAAGLRSGCDAGCDDYYWTHGPAALARAAIRRADLETAVGRVYEPYVRLGRLDWTGTEYDSLGPADVDTLAHRQLAQQAAEQAMVLLRNEPPAAAAGGGAAAAAAAAAAPTTSTSTTTTPPPPLLPLQKEQTIALIGPHLNASLAMLSIYIGGNELIFGNTPLLQLQARGARIVGSHLGCAVPKPPPAAPTPAPTPDPQHRQPSEGLDDTTPCTDDSGFGAAAALAASADVAVVFVGLHPHGFPSNQSTDAKEDEGKDRPYTFLPGKQEALVQAVLAANPRTVVVLIHGAALSVDKLAAPVAQGGAPAILDAHYPGQMGGQAIARTLYGDVSPAGRLTTTFYDGSFNDARAIVDLGLRDKGGITYMHYGGVPQFAFGHGLSYTTFSFETATGSGGGDSGGGGGGAGAATTDTAALASGHEDYYRSGGALPSGGAQSNVVTVTNTGDVTSDAVVLGFVSSNHTDAPANKELFDFARVAQLAPGASATVVLTLPTPVLALVDSDGAEWVRPGAYHLEFGVRGAAECAAPGCKLATATLLVTGEPLQLGSPPAALVQQAAKYAPSGISLV